jgi:acyl-CoA ligase (AMP-forming) (exosortase A-associated)
VEAEVGWVSRIEAPLRAAVYRAPTKIAVVDGDRALTFAELERAAAALAAELVGGGVGTGDRVAIFLDKTLEAVVALYGVWMAGAVAVPVNEGLRARQVRHILDDSGSRVLLTSARNRAGLDDAATAGVVHGAVELDRLAAAPRRPHPGDPPADDAPAIILYTSGSTGRPKGILVSHANLLAGARIVTRYLEIHEDERILSVLPFSFDYGLNQLLTSVGAGATVVLLRSHLPADICRALSRHEITALAGVPTLWIQLMQRHSPLPRQAFPRLRYITNSGGVFPVGLVRRYREHLPDTRLYLMYGLSEAFRSTYLPPDEIDRRPHSMGRAIPETEILVVDEAGRDVGTDAAGELVHAGPTVALGYWNRPEATAAVFRPDPRRADGAGPRVVYSGDLVRRDADGFLTFVGRRDQQIKSHGFRISPEEVEEAIQASNLVAEVVVRGAPDDVAGMVVEAHVVPRDAGRFSAEALRAYCEAELPRHMVPRHIEVHDALPRTASGKVDRARVHVQTQVHVHGHGHGHGDDAT